MALKNIVYSVELDLYGGVHISDAISALCLVAAKLELPVSTEFSGVRLVAGSDGERRPVELQWLKAMKERAERDAE